jgi:cytochrome c
VVLSKQQLADIESSIGAVVANDCFLPIMAVNVEGGMQVAAVDILPGEAKYPACGACHGGNGGGGVGPALKGRDVDYIVGRLNAYREGEKVGNQSNLMWGQAAGLSDQDIQDLAEYIATL